jgi:hypothetical protein
MMEQWVLDSINQYELVICRLWAQTKPHRSGIVSSHKRLMKLILDLNILTIVLGGTVTMSASSRINNKIRREVLRLWSNKIRR